jgi:crotonobetainyl-CoA:carnitine CoA-transferase CaiB-like acyl-CoA transferase
MLGGNADGPLTGHYRCSDGRWVHLSWLEGRQYETFLRREGIYEQWAAEGLLTTERSRFGVDPAYAGRLREKIAEVLATRPAHDWEQRLNPDCDVAPCQTPEEWLLYDDQARVMNAVITLLIPYLGLTHQVGHAVTMSATPPSAEGPRRQLDADRAQILAELGELERRPAPPMPGTPVVLSAALQGFTALDATQLLAGPSAGRVLADYGADVVQISTQAPVSSVPSSCSWRSFTGCAPARDSSSGRRSRRRPQCGARPSSWLTAARTGTSPGGSPGSD